MTDKKPLISGELGWFVISMIIIISLIVGALYQENNINKPEQMKTNYNFCVKGCFQLPNTNNILRNCQLWCEKEVYNEFKEM